MISTIPADLILLFFVGLVFSRASLSRLKTEGSILKSRAFLLALLFSLLCLPISIYCYYLYPAWCWMYWIDPEKVPLAVVLVVFFSYFLSTTLGFILLYKLESWGKDVRIWLFLLNIFGIAFLGALFPERLFMLGTMKDFQNHTLAPVFEVMPVFVTILVGGTILLTLGLLMIRQLSRAPGDPN